MSKLREYLLNNGSIEELKDKYLIKTRRHEKYNNLVLFSYDIGCDFKEEFQLECRGIILDQDDNWKVISKSFNKFFNAGESRAAVIDWSTAKVVAKEDGSMCSLYQYNNHWNVATTGTPDANVPVNDFNITFEQLFYKALNENNLFLPNIQPGITLVFELLSEFNRIVVPHAGCNVIYLGACEAETGRWLELPEIKQQFICPKEYSFRTLEEIVESFNSFKGIDQEGYVIFDSNYNRIKVKHPEYLVLHLALSGTNLKSLVSIALKGEVPETLSYFPYLTDTLNKIQETLENKTKEIDQYYLRGKDIPSRKEYAQFVKDTPYAWVLFKMKDTNLSSLEILREERIENVINLLELNGVNK